MFRGNHAATVDAKGRLKVPTAFHRKLMEDGEPRVFLTSLDGECACIFPMSVWKEIEDQHRNPLDPKSRKFRRYVNAYGDERQLDAQGRVLFPRPLRAKARLLGKVDVLGQGRYLEAWNGDVLRARLEADRPSDEELTDLATGGS